MVLRCVLCNAWTSSTLCIATLETNCVYLIINWKLARWLPSSSVGKASGDASAQGPCGLVPGD